MWICGRVISSHLGPFLPGNDTNAGCCCVVAVVINIFFFLNLLFCTKSNFDDELGVKRRDGSFSSWWGFCTVSILGLEREKKGLDLKWVCFVVSFGSFIHINVFNYYQ